MKDAVVFKTHKKGMELWLLAYNGQVYGPFTSSNGARSKYLHLTK